MEAQRGIPAFSGWLRFRGRRNRKSYLWCFLFFFVVMLVIEIVLGQLFLSRTIPIDLFWIYFVIMIPIKFTYFVITAQRMRDFGLSGWFVLLLIPLAYLDRYVYGLATLAVTFFIMVIPGTRGENRYGPDPIAALQPDFGPGTMSRYEANKTKQEGRTVERPSLSDWKNPQNPQ